jgi:hypothetical protein
MNNPLNPEPTNSTLPPKKTFLKLMQQKGMSRKESMKAWLLKEKLWREERRKEFLPDLLI